jgi:hypothetical protein
VMWIIGCANTVPVPCPVPVRAPNVRSHSTPGAQHLHNIPTRNNLTTMPGLQDALTGIRNINPGDKLIYTNIAQKHSISRALRCAVPRRIADLHQRKLTLQQEVDLVQYIETPSTRHLPPTRTMVQNFASKVAQNPCSDSWVTRFLHRHRDQLTCQWATGMDFNRHNAESGYKYMLYFDPLQQKITKYNFDPLQQKITKYNVKPENTYNMDEKGFAIGVFGRSKRIFSRRQYEKKEVRQARQDGSREWVSVRGCAKVADA